MNISNNFFDYYKKYSEKIIFFYLDLKGLMEIRLGQFLGKIIFFFS